MNYCVINCTRQTLVASELEVAETAWSRMKGLIGRPAEKFQPGQGLCLAPAESIHTIGMSYPIDVAYLDANKRVIRTYHQLPPLRIAVVKLKARSILELPAGTLAQTGTEVGDLLQFIVSLEDRDRQNVVKG